MRSTVNAMSAKAHALFGRRLRRVDYGELLQCASVGEIAGTLRRKEGFADCLAEINEATVQRAQLEELLRKRLAQLTDRLARYSGGDDLLVTLYRRQGEISLILLAVRLINNHTMHRFIPSMPVYLSASMELDLQRLAEADSFEDLLRALCATPYHKALWRFRPLDGKPVDLVSCEQALVQLHYSRLLEQVDRCYRGRERRELRQLLLAQVDLHNVTVIYRLRRSFHCTQQEIRSRLLLPECRLNARYRALLEDPDGNPPSRLPDTRLRAELKPGFGGLQISVERTQHALARGSFRSSTSPLAATLGYLTMAGIECANLTNIIEGVDLGVAPSVIEPLLIIE